MRELQGIVNSGFACTQCVFYRNIKKISFMYHLLFEGLEILIDAGVASFINSLRAETLGECKEVKVQVGGIEESCISFVL